MPQWLRVGFITPRFQYRWPWSSGDPWCLGVLLRVDGFCNPAVVLSLSVLGSVVIFWKPGRLRGEDDGPCEQCLALAATT